MTVKRQLPSLRKNKLPIQDRSIGCPTLNPTAIWLASSHGGVTKIEDQTGLQLHSAPTLQISLFTRKANPHHSRGSSLHQQDQLQNIDKTFPG
ncbi:hypothetical protein H6P81_001612 [Aristolochia fimbriata]|uniref:Uncharacterized protein n=1 Tax=Aristolochia fimbriata TaxID=158543 RepID=A0AAV7F914_ARIFI|nr:hypothetical protein H6P81_001612 [Aristolochia fimbriata]